MSGRLSNDGVTGRTRVLVDCFDTCLERGHLVRTCTIAIVVGSWLTLFNQGDTILASGTDALLMARVGLNYLTPFAVANLGLLSRQRGTDTEN